MAGRSRTNPTATTGQGNASGHQAIVTDAALPSSSVVYTPRGIRVLCLHSELKNVCDLVPFPRNPNTHPPEQIAILARIIGGSGAKDPQGRCVDGGWRQPIVVSRRSGFITKGHGRRLAALSLRNSVGELMVPVEYQSYGSEAEEWADIVADNHIAELSDLNPGMVRSLMEEVRLSVPTFDLASFAISFPDFAPVDIVEEAPRRTKKEAAFKIFCSPEQNEQVKAALRQALGGMPGVAIV